MKNVHSDNLAHMKSDINRYVLSIELFLKDFIELIYSRNNTDFLVNCYFSMYYEMFSDLDTLKALKVREFLFYNWIFWKANLKMSQSNVNINF